jgi:hypothetical protein
MEQLNTNYCFVLLNEIFDFGKDIKIDLGNFFILKKADKEQISYFKSYIEIFKDKSWTNYFENELLPYKVGECYKFQNLTKSKWRYCVIEYTHKQYDNLIFSAMKISDLNITPLIEVFFLEGDLHGHSFKTVKSLNLINDTTDKYMELGTKRFLRNKPSDNSIINFQETCNAVMIISKSTEKMDLLLMKAINDYMEIDCISNKSTFKVLGFISILESLLTNNNRNGFDNSINKQLSKKINLLYNNFNLKFDYQTYFKGSDSNSMETIISKLYEYRCDIAHGNIPNFEKELRLLYQNKDMILDFLDILIRKLLQFAIFNPKLLRDLKEC